MTEIPQVKTALSSLPAGADRYVAIAPGRLDVMGGSAVYTGSLALSLPLSSRAFAVAQRRRDGVVSVRLLQTRDQFLQVAGYVAAGNGTNSRNGSNGANPQVRCDVTEVSLDAAAFADGDAAALKAAVDKIDEPYRDTLGAVIVALMGLIEVAGSALAPADDGITGGDRADFRAGGLTLVVGTDMAHRAGAGCGGAIGAAVVAAGGCALGLDVNDSLAVRSMEQVRPELTPTPISAADVLGGLFANHGQFTQLRNDPCSLAKGVPLPEGMLIVGVDSGAAHEKAREKYWLMRTTAAMGCELLARIINHDCPEKAQWDRFLSRISVTEFVERFRDRIPTRLRGKDYRERFGPLTCPGCVIEEDQIYKVRSRTEHHIYEHERALQFAHHTTRLSRMHDVNILDELGELMFASHWSYGQRCGLGSIEADALVNILRKRRDDGIFGAKITANGCGGMVAVLLEDTESARGALHAALEAFHERTGKTATVLESDGAGIMETGVART